MAGERFHFGNFGTSHTNVVKPFYVHLPAIFVLENLIAQGALHFLWEMFVLYVTSHVSSIPRSVVTHITMVAASRGLLPKICS